MRIANIVLIVLLMIGPARATDYYVATNGANSNPGTLAQPFRTIQQAAAAAHAGDNVYIKEGTYRETVAVLHSGTAAAPITFQPYQGARVTVTGLEPVASSWTNYSGSIYSANLTSGLRQVFVNGQAMIGARTPNPVYNNPLRAIYNTIDSVSIQSPQAPSSLTSAALGNPSNGLWNGARLAALANSSELATWSTAVTSQTGNTLNFNWNYPGYIPVPGNHYYLYGSLAALSASKQYYYDSSASKLYLHSPGGANPNGASVEVQQRTYGFNLGSQSYIHLSGLRVLAASINVAGNNNLINNVQVLYPTPFTDPAGTFSAGVNITGQHNTVQNSEIAYSWGDGVTLKNANNTVNNNVIHDVNLNGDDSAGIEFYNAGGNTTITNNTIYNTGRSGITFSSTNGSPNTLIQHNDISRFGLLTGDLGGIYSGSGNNQGLVIAYNQIHDSGPSHDSANGIYLDGGNVGVAIHNNLVHNISGVGVVVNKSATNINVYNNTLWNVGQATSTYGPDQTYTLNNVKTYNNLSNAGGWVGTDVQKNLTTVSSPFVNIATGDYTLKMGPNPAVDYGITDASHPTDPFVGANPDAGAFERGNSPWSAGASWKTWLFTNQVTAPLTTAVYVTPGNVRTSSGPLVVGNASGVDNRAFLKFDLSGVQNIPIEGAVLRIYEIAKPSIESGDVLLQPVASPWTAANVDYTQSTFAGVSGFYDPANLDLYTDIDVTAIVRAWLADPSTNFGFRLSGNSAISGSAKFFDGFYGITAPQLVLTYGDLPGDFDGDGDVDGADFVVWQTHFPTASGASLASGDADGDGDVDGADFVVWQTHFPLPLGGSAAQLAEPSSLILFLFAVPVGMAGRWRWNKRKPGNQSSLELSEVGRNRFN